MTPLAAGTLSLLLWLGADVKSEAYRQDLEMLQGTWTVVSMEMDGKFLPEERRKKTKVTVQGEKFTFDTGDDSHEGLYKIDPSKDPKELNIVVTRGDEKGKVYLAIYKFEDGKMIQGMRLDNKERPKQFTGKAGTGCALEIWERQKP
jgi:uncharacterized protein (TIGR03067 family)